MATATFRVHGSLLEGAAAASSKIAIARSIHTSCIVPSGKRQVHLSVSKSANLGKIVDLRSFSGKKDGERRDGVLSVRMGASASASAPAASTSNPKLSGQVRPSPAEAARTIVDISNEGTLSTLTETESWPTATAVRFALDAQGNPVFRFSSSALHTRNLALDNRASLHVQLEQPGRQKPQCTLRGRIVKAEEPDLQEKLEIAWERRFGIERAQDDAYFIMVVEQALQSQDMGEEEVWMSGDDYSSAVADPLREFAVKIVDDMNQKHWEDVRRFTNVYAGLDVEVEEVSMTWVDRLGFDLRVLTKSREMLEIRIPFVREVTDERDARSSLTMMAQIAWERERSYNPPDVAFVGSFSVSSGG
ncbi:heme oxygenase (biliverdin-IX-beta and delta-forming) [Marchantia polymorpha subsp. ruderalis]|uniref:DUF2470 domain-containing protein n=2 Tax=Marchantia polymorpha TaxID=3197 RepID=A0AAF6AL14_MARPO|nr:hypothetical protein MARPO_0005s0279 [Marchantia polymorpha]BBM97134.1 hypothetical protein Mp_1g03280 [Marchantia polymorpha subsp. ruderalis]|eukprot:PTQ48671.1 hypothetical protein MARPO_0005s0279 [Marchantia polymorpha]